MIWKFRLQDPWTTGPGSGVSWLGV